jgi:hypothetical protein
MLTSYLEGGDEPFYPTQVFSNGGQQSLHQRQYSLGSNNGSSQKQAERRYPAMQSEEYQQHTVLLTADEKVHELNGIVEQ